MEYKTKQSKKKKEKSKEKKNHRQLFNMSILFGISNVIYQECKRLFAHHRIANLLKRFYLGQPVAPVVCLFDIAHPPPPPLPLGITQTITRQFHWLDQDLDFIHLICWHQLAEPRAPSRKWSGG